MRGRAGSNPKISVFLSAILVSRLENFSLYAHFIMVTRMRVGESYSAIRVAKAMIGWKVITLCFATFALFLEFCARTRPQDLWLFLNLNPGLKCLI